MKTINPPFILKTKQNKNASIRLKYNIEKLWALLNTNTIFKITTSTTTIMKGHDLKVCSIYGFLKFKHKTKILFTVM